MFNRNPFAGDIDFPVLCPSPAWQKGAIYINRDTNFTDLPRSSHWKSNHRPLKCQKLLATGFTRKLWICLREVTKLNARVIAYGVDKKNL
jgi:hypothetical protein